MPSFRSSAILQACLPPDCARVCPRLVCEFAALDTQHQPPLADVPRAPPKDTPPSAAPWRRFAEDATFFTNSNDPEGFNIVDVLAYGALGHALGFFLLAASSLNQKPIPF